MRHAAPWFLTLTLATAAASCSAPTSASDECPAVVADNWSVIHWSTSEGNGSTGCQGPVLNTASTHSESGDRRYWGSSYGEEPTLPIETRVPGRALPSPICAPPGFEFQNYPLVAGTTGPITNYRYPPSGFAGEPNFYLQLQIPLEGMADCSAGADAATVVSGTFEITDGGAWGEPVEFVVHDVVFDIGDGRTFTIDEATWHYTLTPEPILMP